MTDAAAENYRALRTLSIALFLIPKTDQESIMTHTSLPQQCYEEEAHFAFWRDECATLSCWQRQPSVLGVLRGQNSTALLPFLAAKRPLG